jgi:hypothetical protein
MILTNQFLLIINIFISQSHVVYILVTLILFHIESETSCEYNFAIHELVMVTRIWKCILILVHRFL